MSTLLAVRYGNTTLNSKQTRNIALPTTAQEPFVQVDSEGCYTLLMIDPDAGEGRGRETGIYFLHWLVLNISGGMLERGKTIVSYFPPSPPKGKHTYIFKLYKQDCSMTYSVNRPSELSNWNLNNFVNKYGLQEVAEVTMKTGQ